MLTTNPHFSEFAQVLSQTVFQSSLSAAIALFFGVVGAMGLLAITNPIIRRFTEVFIMIPSLVPVLFVIIASLNFISSFAPFPFGMIGVVFIHSILNIGLVSVAVARLFEGAMGGVIELASVEGATRVQIIKAVLAGLRRELSILGFYIFSICFTSFSVPLIVGAGTGDTIEVLIYRAVLGRGELNYGIVLAILQIAILASFSFFLKNPFPETVKINRNLTKVQSLLSLVFILTFTAGVVISSFAGWTRGISEILVNNELQARIWERIGGTFIECLLVAVFVLLGLLLVAYRSPHRFCNRILLAYSAPSAVITGLIIYLIFNAQAAKTYQVFLWIAFGFVLTIFTMIYRFRAAHIITNLEAQISSARILGASHNLIFKEILLPQVWRDFCFLAGVSALWASGDFALASLISGREMTLATMAQGLLGGYRMEVATVVVWISLAIGFLIFILFEMVGRLGYSKSHS